jgi:hypothetical protein
VCFVAQLKMLSPEKSISAVKLAALRLEKANTFLQSLSKEHRGTPLCEALAEYVIKAHYVYESTISIDNYVLSLVDNDLLDNAKILHKVEERSLYATFFQRRGPTYIVTELNMDE